MKDVSGMDSDREREPKQDYHEPHLTEYGDALDLTESTGTLKNTDGGGAYGKVKTA